MHTSHTRDAALRELHRINRWLVAGSVVLTGVFAEAAAHAFPGRTAKAASGSHAKRSGVQPGSASSTSTTSPLQPPAHAPQATSEPTSSPESQAPAQEATTAPEPEPAREPAPARESPPAQESAPAQESTHRHGTGANPRTPTCRRIGSCHLRRLLRCPRPPHPPPLGSCWWEALGTSVVLRTVDPAAVAVARAAVERELAAIDHACSRFRADSELSCGERPGRAMDSGQPVAARGAGGRAYAPPS